MFSNNFCGKLSALLKTCVLTTVVVINFINQPHAQRTAESKNLAGVEVISETGGMDFSSYLHEAIQAIKENWYGLVPPEARAPKMTNGDVIIEFAILKNGKQTGMKLVENSADVQMGNAAWHSISDSRFRPLPPEFSGQYVALRLHFSYNPSKPSDLILQYKE